MGVVGDVIFAELHDLTLQSLLRYFRRTRKALVLNHPIHQTPHKRMKNIYDTTGENIFPKSTVYKMNKRLSKYIHILLTRDNGDPFV